MLNDKVCKEIRGHPIACFVQAQRIIKRKTTPVQLQTSQVNLQAIIDHANYAWRSVRLYTRQFFYNGKCSHACILKIIRYFSRILKLVLQLKI